MLSYNERLNLVIDAQDHLRTAIDLIQQAVEDTPLEARADAYVIGHLKSWMDSLYNQPANLEEIANELEALGLDETGPQQPDDLGAVQVTIKVGSHGVSVRNVMGGFLHSEVYGECPAFNVAGVIGRCQREGWFITGFVFDFDPLSASECLDLAALAGL